MSWVACTCQLSTYSFLFVYPIIQFSFRDSWEIVINLDYELSVLTGKRKLTGTFPV